MKKVRSLRLRTQMSLFPEVARCTPPHVQLWLKRLRKAIAPQKIRYFAVGEYGDRSWRPHYHVALFGYATCGRTYYVGESPTCCFGCVALHDSWRLGRVFSGSLNVASAQYVCGYVTKKMTRFDDARLGNRHPEFARMSLRPGIGALRLPDIVSVLSKFNLADTQGDVPSSLRCGSRLMPLGRYLRGQLREALGVVPPSQRKGLIDEQLQQMLLLRFDKEFLASGKSYKEALVSADDQSVLNASTRRSIFKKEKPL